ncbi:hypothetical protein, variant [Blastomyces dermatitidis ER-3]|uniref:IEC3 subunit of the Ino80 complex, chromatin re-modelling-domain-containing protein n=2 Tax=Blastomyces TaxID=229219 RepID=A0A179V314_BLAGS|nr:hypothetical protein, variant [Blastomyces gilchristii SLH14081]XP_045281244.1 hypothetical protein, variant [Blastomyces dermatitidis ER-3]EQL29590.1 hypothetical protein, variant [Blastomyces dermatitidis ATCC 26199]OAT01517.1 hypothetical protein, variant [Blastomyces dermatitidis ER-3]OAT13829.1 hypothetical protein, variant [Blastomyces gilchristii SLH14081]
MASPEPASPSPERSLPDAPPLTHQTTYKSFKRKYAKQKICFEHAMKKSNTLFKEELRIRDLSKRLKEQNDQLLEALLELNNSIRVPPELRYNLDLPGSKLPRLHSPEPEHYQQESYDTETAREALRVAKERLLAGEIKADQCRRLEESLLQSENFAPAVQYSSLLKVPHTTSSIHGDHPAMKCDMDSTLGFLSPEHETEYAAALDAASAGEPRPAGKSASAASRDREAAIRNPVSVINWLRKHQPSKRASTHTRKDEDIYDEDGILIDVPATGGGSGGGGGRGKRKRDEDGGYRPKGGSGGRSRKKKEDAPKRAKRSSAAGATT